MATGPTSMPCSGSGGSSRKHDAGARKCERWNHQTVPVEHLVLVVGAGVSRNLSASSELMPLMADWNETLRQALTEQDSALAPMVGIHHGQSGPKFEKAIGDFLTWRRSIDLSAQFLSFGFQSQTPTDTQGWRAQADFRAGQIVTALRQTLYDQFGMDRISTVAAKQAYEQLFDGLDLVNGGSLTIATTNYDPAVEIALAELERKPQIGAHDGPGGLTFLDPENLISSCRAGSGTPVLHLHGKVGWYTQEDASVQIHSPQHAYNDSAGTPTVLWPDPEKNPTLEPGIRSLWEQFDSALGQATHILVIGHSMHDPFLLDRLRRAGSARRAVAVHPSEDGDAMKAKFPEATMLEIDFGPQPDLDRIKEWSGRTS